MSTAPDKRAGVPAVHYRVAWLLLLGAIVLAEVVALFTREALDVLSATMWWAYGPRYGVRWWLLGSLVAALFAWCPVHWWFPSVGARHLAVMVGVALVGGVVGWVVTR